MCSYSFYFGMTHSRNVFKTMGCLMYLNGHKFIIQMLYTAPYEYVQFFLLHIMLSHLKFLDDNGLVAMHVIVTCHFQLYNFIHILVFYFIFNLYYRFFG